jgi:predicted nucleotidyltransferase
MYDTDKEYTPEEWRALKVDIMGEIRTPFPSKEDQQFELGRIAASLKRNIIKCQEIPDEWKEEAGDIAPEDYIKAVIIISSWADGNAAIESDVDLIWIREDKYRNDNLTDYIESDTMEEIDRYVESVGWADWNNEAALKKQLDDLGNDAIVVTPFPEVQKHIKAIKATTRFL